MTLSFIEYLTEVLGTDSMEKDPADLILAPDLKRASAMMTLAGSSGTIPAQWSNSSFITGGRLTSAFGLNPKEVKKKTVLNYYEFIQTTKKFSK